MIRTSLPVASTWYFLDQVSKWWIIEVVMKPPKIIEITSFFNIVLGWNTGVSFGFLTSLGLPPWVLALFSVSVAFVLLAWLGRTSSTPSLVALGLIVGGALANATDRVRQGAVTDFLDFHIGKWHWPAFNMADTGIVCGTALLIVHALVTRADDNIPGKPGRQQ